jgi:hypothetical protein
LLQHYARLASATDPRVLCLLVLFLVLGTCAWAQQPMEQSSPQSVNAVR